MVQYSMSTHSIDVTSCVRTFTRIYRMCFCVHLSVCTSKWVIALTCACICKWYYKPVPPCVWITEFVCTRGYTACRTCCHGNQDRGSVGGCPHGSSDNLYFLQLCVTPILTPNPWRNKGAGGLCCMCILWKVRETSGFYLHNWQQ